MVKGRPHRVSARARERVNRATLHHPSPRLPIGGAAPEPQADEKIAPVGVPLRVVPLQRFGEGALAARLLAALARPQAPILVKVYRARLGAGDGFAALGQ